MDHAGWVQSRIAHMKPRKPTKRERDAAAEHKGWLAAPDQLNAFQRRAFDILGIVGGGIYNCPIAWRALVWAPCFIVAPWYHSLATWDFGALTRLVLLCHDARIRADVSPCNRRYLHVSLHQRAAEGCVSVRHPSLTEAVTGQRSEISEQHTIYFQPPVVEAAE